MTLNASENLTTRTTTAADTDMGTIAGTSATGQALKRLCDVLFASLCMVIVAVPALLTALLVKLTSPGPIIYRQTRVGLGGREFQVLKFRTMKVDAEAQSGPIWATNNDDRCTPVGNPLRKFFLDEIPQLVNVLCGDMSVVGPRPERPFFVEQFRQALPHYSRRHEVRPGITGLAQIYGWRCKTDIRMRTVHDIWYVDNWSPWLDLMILGRTFLFVCGIVTREAVVMPGVKKNPPAEAEAIMAVPPSEDEAIVAR